MKIALSLLLIIVLCTAVFGAIMEGTASSVSFPKRLGVSRLGHYDPKEKLEDVPIINQFVSLKSIYGVKSYGVGRGGASDHYSTPQGSARLRSVQFYGYPVTQISVKAVHLPTTAESKGHFEAWLVDDETNYRLSLGTFNTQTGGVADLRYVAELYIHEYDYVEITFEPLHDMDTTPGPLVMYGKIAPQPFS